jgi:hypothetical protein
MIFAGTATGRYQHLKLFVCPKTAMRQVPAPVVAVAEERWIEPMPVLL